MKNDKVRMVMVEERDERKEKKIIRKKKNWGDKIVGKENGIIEREFG